MEHLNKQTQSLILKSNEERIIAAKQFKWIGHTKAISIIKDMENLMNYPKSSRMPNILLVGDSNNGKTALIKKFENKHTPYLSKEKSLLCAPVVLFQMPPEPDERRFYNAILERLYAPYKTSEKLEVRQSRVKNLLIKLNVKLLIIDEIHHILAGTPTKQRKFLNVLKYISNELNIPLVCAGTSDAFNAIQSDPQTANRFHPKILNRWQFDTEYKRLLVSFERQMPLKHASHLQETNIARKILAMSEGLIGEVSKILELSTILAIESGIEKVVPNILQNIDYISPTNRKKFIYRI